MYLYYPDHGSPKFDVWIGPRKLGSLGGRQYLGHIVKVEEQGTVVYRTKKASQAGRWLLNAAARSDEVGRTVDFGLQVKPGEVYYLQDYLTCKRNRCAVRVIY